MEMTKEQENGVIVEDKKTIMNENLLELNVCFHQILDTCTNMNGKFMYGMHKNINIIKPYLEKLNKARKEVVLKYAELDDNGEPKLSTGEEKPNQYIYKKGNEKKAFEEFNKLLKKEISIDFYKIDVDIFGEVSNIDVNKISSLGTFIDLIVE